MQNKNPLVSSEKNYLNFQRRKILELYNRMLKTLNQIKREQLAEKKQWKEYRYYNKKQKII